MLLRVIRLVPCLLIILVLAPSAPGVAAQAQKPFSLPFSTPPGPSTWLMVQAYGNTTTAYRWRVSQYGAGQGLHFGLDFGARCGTQVIAIGDGTVVEVDESSHGAGPHNLTIDHPNGYASFYGHLYERPRLATGDTVRQGQVIGLTGDPDLTCESRPHLHLEIRDAPGHSTAYNPVTLIEADWDALALGATGNLSFERNLDDPRQWQYLDDQPDVAFGARLLNQYTHAWPPEWGGP